MHLIVNVYKDRFKSKGIVFFLDTEQDLGFYSVESEVTVNELFLPTKQ